MHLHVNSSHGYSCTFLDLIGTHFYAAQNLKLLRWLYNYIVDSQ